MWDYSVHKISALFLVIDLLIFVERGILPGLHHEVIKSLIKADVELTNPESRFGLLQSIFIAGLALSAPLLTHMSVRTERPIQFLAFGLVLWVLSLYGCAVAGTRGWIGLLYLCRAFTGIGEAAFASLLTPVLLDAQSPKSRGLFLGLFYSLMSIGVALGYVLSSMLPKIGYSYPAAFAMLGTISAPFVVGVVCLSLMAGSQGMRPWKHDEAPSETEVGEQHTVGEAGMQRPRSATGDVLTLPGGDGVPTHLTTLPAASFFAETNLPLFSCMLIAGAAQAATTATLNAFGTSFLTALDLFETEVKAAVAVGTVAVCVGSLGTFSGGLLCQRFHPNIPPAELAKKCCRIIAFFGFAGSVACMFTPVALSTGNGVTAMATLAFGLLLVCMCQAALNVGVMASTALHFRSFALSLYTLGIHLVGDVPGPVFIGWLKDRLAPGCVAVHSAACELQRPAIVIVIAVLLSWTHVVWVGGISGRWLTARAAERARLALKSMGGVISGGSLDYHEGGDGAMTTERLTNGGPLSYAACKQQASPASSEGGGGLRREEMGKPSKKIMGVPGMVVSGSNIV